MRKEMGALLLIVVVLLPMSQGGGIEVTVGGVEKTTFDAGQKAIFEVTFSLGGNATYTWDFGDGETAEGPVVSHVYSHGGEYTVTLKAYNESTPEVMYNVTVRVRGLTPAQSWGIVGVGIMMTLVGLASAFGLGLTAASAVGVAAEKDVSFGKLIVLQVLPMTQTIYAFLTGYLLLSALGIIGGIGVPPPIATSSLTVMAALGICVIVGATGISAIPQGMAASASLAATGRNPEVASKGIIFSAMPETIALFGLILVILIMNGMGLM